MKEIETGILLFIKRIFRDSSNPCLWNKFIDKNKILKHIKKIQLITILCLQAQQSLTFARNTELIPAVILVTPRYENQFLSLSYTENAAVSVKFWFSQTEMKVSPCYKLCMIMYIYYSTDYCSDVLIAEEIVRYKDFK